MQGVKRKVEKYDLDGTFMELYESIASAARDVEGYETEGLKGNIRRACLLGNGAFAGGFIWKFKEDYGYERLDR